MRVALPDGSDLVVSDEATPADVAETIGPRLAKAAVAARVGDQLVDLSVPLAEGDRVEIVTGSSPEGLDVMRLGVQQARRGGLTKDDVANTRSWAKMKKLIGRR